MKGFLFFFVGIIIGSWFSWPGIIFPENWKCFIKIINSSKNEKVSLKAILSVSPKYLLKKDTIDNYSKLRIVGDACFR